MHFIFFNFSSSYVWREGGENLKEFKRGKNEPMGYCHDTMPWGAREAHGGRGLLWPWASRPPSRAHKAWPLAKLAPLALFSRSSTVSGPLNSDFESVFGLQIMTPSRTMMTIKLWQKVENSSRKTTTKITQRMRTQSSVATSFELET